MSDEGEENMHNKEQNPYSRFEIGSRIDQPSAEIGDPGRSFDATTLGAKIDIPMFEKDMSEAPKMRGSIDDDLARQFGLTSPEGRERESIERIEEIIRQRIEFGLVSPEREMLIKARNPEQLRWATMSFVKEIVSTMSDAPFYFDRYGALDFYRILKSRQRLLESGMPEKEKLIEYLGLEEIGIQTHEIVPNLNLEEYPISDQWEDKVKKSVGSRNEIIKQKKQQNEKERYESEKLRPLMVEELDGLSKFFIAITKQMRFIEDYQSTGGSIDLFAKEFTVPMLYHEQALDLKAMYGMGPTLMEREGKTIPPELKSSPETRSLKKDWDTVMRAYYLVGLSEKPKVLSNYMKMPGFTDVFLADIPENERGSWIREWIGDVDSWDLDESGNRKQEPEKRSYDDVKKEREPYTEPNGEIHEHGKRGKLTQFGNTWTHKENTEERERLREVVKELVGGNSMAEELGFWDFRTKGLAARFGGEKYWNEEKKIWKYDVEGFPGGSDDLTKIVLTRLWQNKDYLSGHPIGPKETVGQVERFVEAFFMFASAEDVEVNGVKRERTIDELWWGYPEEEGKPKEEAHMLGDVPWDKFKPEVFRDWMLRVYFAGSENGFLNKWKTVNWDPKVLYYEQFWRQINKELNIMIGPTLVAKGNLRYWDGLTDEGKNKRVQDAKTRIKELFNDGIMRNAENLHWLFEKGGMDGNATNKKLIEEAQKRAGY